MVDNNYPHANSNSPKTNSDMFRVNIIFSRFLPSMIIILCLIFSIPLLLSIIKGNKSNIILLIIPVLLIIGPIHVWIASFIRRYIKLDPQGMRFLRGGKHKTTRELWNEIRTIHNMSQNKICIYFQEKKKKPLRIAFYSQKDRSKFISLVKKYSDIQIT